MLLSIFNCNCKDTFLGAQKGIICTLSLCVFFVFCRCCCFFCRRRRCCCCCSCSCCCSCPLYLLNWLCSYLKKFPLFTPGFLLRNCLFLRQITWNHFHQTVKYIWEKQHHNHHPGSLLALSNPFYTVILRKTWCVWQVGSLRLGNYLTSDFNSGILHLGCLGWSFVVWLPSVAWWLFAVACT